MMKIAVLGASGFIGSRCIEMFHLGGAFEVVPVLRCYGSMARTARFDLDWRIADARDTAALRLAFQGCDVVVDCVLGNPHVIVEAAAASYNAANQAAVKKLIYLSSSAVHGQAPAPGTDEQSPLSTRHQLPYNRAKVRAEQMLYRLSKTGATQLTVLRPGIVYGPRSRWVATLAEELLNSTAYLLEDGRGICNTIYVDNLLEAIKVAVDCSDAANKAFLVGDDEVVTWWDFYSRFAGALGVETDSIARITAPKIVQTWKNLVEQFRCSQTVQSVSPLVPAYLKRAVKSMLMQPSPPPNPYLRHRPQAQPTLEMCLLQQCKCKLGSEQAKTVLGYRPTISFDEGCRRSIGWLQFCGYPVMSTWSNGV